MDLEEATDNVSHDVKAAPDNDMSEEMPQVKLVFSEF